MDKSIKGITNARRETQELRIKRTFARQVAAELDVDTYISKMENNDKPVSKSHLEALAKVYDLPESELMPYWLEKSVSHLRGA